jgi:hypothetical protein
VSRTSSRVEVDVRRHRLRRLQREVPRERAEALQERLLTLVEQVVAPVHCFAQRPVSRDCGSRTSSENAKRVVEARCDLLRRERAHASRDELDGEGKTVETPTDLRNRGGIDGRQSERRESGLRTIHEQLRRWRVRDPIDRLFIAGRHCEARYQPCALATYTQCFAARHERVQSGQPRRSDSTRRPPPARGARSCRARAAAALPQRVEDRGHRPSRAGFDP